jgi:hypothetical protein
MLFVHGPGAKSVVSERILPVKRLALLTIATIAAGFALVTTAFAAPLPVTYLNANFGPPNTSGLNFYRSHGTNKFQSATATVIAQGKAFQGSFFASANGDPNETSSGFSSYDVGTVNKDLEA